MEEDRIQLVLPNITDLVGYIQHYFNSWLDTSATDDDGGGDEDLLELSFILAQLLQMAAVLDYADEVGRRNMYSLISNSSLPFPSLP